MGEREMTEKIRGVWRSGRLFADEGGVCSEDSKNIKRPQKKHPPPKKHVSTLALPTDVTYHKMLSKLPDAGIEPMTPHFAPWKFDMKPTFHQKKMVEKAKDIQKTFKPHKKDRENESKMAEPFFD